MASDPSDIPDWLDIAPEYRLDVLSVYRMCIMNGDENYLFNPQKNLTRAEAITVMNNLNKDISTINFGNDIMFPAEQAYSHALIDASHLFWDIEPLRYDSNIKLLEIACKEHVVNHQRYPQYEFSNQAGYVYDEEKINEILENAKGLYCEDLVKQIVEEIRAGWYCQGGKLCNNYHGENFQGDYYE